MIFGAAHQARPHRIAALGIARTFQNIARFRGLTVLESLLLGRHVHMRTNALAALLRPSPGARRSSIAGWSRRSSTSWRSSRSAPADWDVAVRPPEAGRAGAGAGDGAKVLLLDEPMAV